jgi:hypothetical protein
MMALGRMQVGGVTSPDCSQRTQLSKKTARNNLWGMLVVGDAFL